MIGIGGAARLNEYIHEFLPKTYLATGKLGIETPTGDYTSEVSQRDESLYLLREIAGFSQEFIEEKLCEKFLGDYWQSPHQFSATKFMGKNLHEWARQGVEIKKAPVLRKVFKIEVIKYSFPYLSIRVEVSSGTYVRTLFSDMCRYLGTLGSLISLVRERVGQVNYQDSLHQGQWPQDKSPSILMRAIPIEKVLPFSQIKLNGKHSVSFKNGAFLKAQDLMIENQSTFSERYYWMIGDEGKLLGLAEKTSLDQFRPKISFHSEDQAASSSDHGLE